MTAPPRPYAEPVPAPDAGPAPAAPVRATRVFALFALVAVLALAALALTLSLRPLALGDDGRAAYATMAVPRPPVVGHGGFVDLYLADHVVPADRVEAVIAAERAHLAALAPEVASPRRPSPPRLLGTAAYPPRPPLDGAAMCRASRCYEQVRADPDAMRALLAANPERLAAVERALAADHLRSPFPETSDTPAPPYRLLGLALGAAALDAVDGRTAEAYARTCTLLASMRRTSAEPDGLVDKMVGVHYARGAAELLLALRRHHPVRALPATCAEAVAPLRDAEGSVCEAMRGEYRLVAAQVPAFAAYLARKPPIERALWSLLFDPELQRAWHAMDFSDFCSPARAALAVRGLPAPMVARPGPPEFGGPACLTAYVSCVYANVALPRHDDYARLTLDETARLRVLLAAQAIADGRMAPEAAARSASVEGYPVRFDPATGLATLALLGPGGRPTEATVDLSGLAPAAGER